jgi:hypothetical protein
MNEGLKTPSIIPLQRTRRVPRPIDGEKWRAQNAKRTTERDGTLASRPAEF